MRTSGVIDRRRIASLLLATLLTTTLVFGNASRAHAGELISYTGQFKIEYPEPWEQVDYTTADLYVAQVLNRMDYEAIFTAGDADQVFTGTYLILTVDTIGRQTEQQIDSIIASIAQAGELIVQSSSFADFLIQPQAGILTYVADSQLVALESDVTEDPDWPRRSILVMKFYEGGIANFFFYSDEHSFAENLATYRQIVTSLDCENWQKKPSPDSVRIVSTTERDKEGSRPGVITWGGLIVVLIVIIVAARKRRRSKQT